MTLQEAGHKVIDGMRGTPALLAVIVLQMVTLALIYVLAEANAQRIHERELALIETCERKE